MLPLYQILPVLRAETRLLVPRVGPLSPHLARLLGGRIGCVEGGRPGPGDRTADLIGLNPHGVRLSRGLLDEFKAAVLRDLGIEPCERPFRAVLIERRPPHEFYHSLPAELRGSGTARRSIVNHADLRGMLTALAAPSLEFTNAVLEEMTIEQQLRIFDEAVLVIGQHGAGLANLLWMKPGAHVVEIRDRTMPLAFADLGRERGIDHRAYRVAGRHVTLDLGRFARWLQGRKRLGGYFRAR